MQTRLEKSYFYSILYFVVKSEIGKYDNVGGTQPIPLAYHCTNPRPKY